MTEFDEIFYTPVSLPPQKFVLPKCLYRRQRVRKYQDEAVFSSMLVKPGITRAAHTMPAKDKNAWSYTSTSIRLSESHLINRHFYTYSQFASKMLPSEIKTWNGWTDNQSCNMNPLEV